MRKIRVIGIGAGHPDQVTVEAIRALRSVDYFITADKGDDDPLLAARQALLERHLDDVPPIVAVRDPERDRSPDAYGQAVDDWHEARADAYEIAILERDGDVGFLVWGDPAFYDSTIRIVEKVLSRGNVEAQWDVIPGISSLQLLAARHRIVLHDVGQPILVTTGRRLQEALEADADNILVMLNSTVDLEGFEAYNIWWGANLGTADERLISGRAVEVAVEVLQTRIEMRSTVGWIMDIFLLRKV